MKVSYKEIRYKRSLGCQTVDHYYDLSVSDFFTDEDIRQMELDHILYHLRLGKLKRGEITVEQFEKPFPEYLWG